MQSRPLGSEFPNYEQVFPKNVTAELRMNKDSLFQTLQRASLFIGLEPDDCLQPACYTQGRILPLHQEGFYFFLKKYL